MKKPIKTLHAFVVSLVAAIFSAATFAQVPPDNQPDTTVDAQTRTTTIKNLVKTLDENYVFPDVADQLGKMLEKHQAHGDYNSVASAKEFAELLTRQMSDTAHDPHLRVVYRAQAPRPPGPTTPGPVARSNPENYGLVEVKQLDGNIGYLKILGFTMDMDHAAPVAAGAMAFLANTDALIIDLRQNHGGAPEMVAFLASYFFDRSVHLNDLDYRKPGTRDYETTQHWTLSYVPGQRYLNKEVYILTGHDTPSAAEEFTYDLQALKRATVVGEVTWGGANPGGVMPLTEHFGVFLPKGHSVSPVTHTNWEGVGIKPDIEVPRDEALQVAQKSALEHLIAKATDERELNALNRALANVASQPSEQQKQ
jgi:retinol-binding protein 3